MSPFALEACDPVRELVYGSAVLSDDGIYRYKLSRDADVEGSARRLLWIALNPSTADALEDDATIRKLKGFATRWDYPALDIVNVFAYRTKSPKVLLDAQRRGVDIVGPENDAHIARAVAEATLVVAAWGSEPIVKSRLASLKAHLAKAREVVALMTTNTGMPYHPLYVPYSTQPKPFTL